MFRGKLYASLSTGAMALAGLLLLVYVALKAGSTSFTHDESFTYLDYVHQGFMDIISYKTPYTNNHILNTVLMKYAEELWGSSELVLRLPNIFACALYLAYAYRLLRSFPLVLMLPAFLCVFCHTQFCDFFSLARGYGLSFAFMLVSLYHLLQYLEKADNKHLILFNAGALLAILANFSLINFYLSALFAYNLILYYRSRLQQGTHFLFLRLNRIHMWSLLVFIAILYEPIRRISKQGMLNFGGKEGFFENTFGSLVGGAFYETPLSRWGFILIVCVMTAVLIATGVLIGWHLLKKNHHFFNENQGLCLTWLILMSLAALSYLQHWLIHNDFYAGRFGLFVYPLFILHVCYLLRLLYQAGGVPYAAILTYGLGVALAVLFFMNVNLRYYKDWRYDAGTRQAMLSLVKDQAPQTPDRSVELGINWLFEPTTNFYRYTWNLHWLKKTHRRGAGSHSQYYYLLRTDTNAWLGNGKPLLFSSDDAQSFLVRNHAE